MALSQLSPEAVQLAEQLAELERRLKALELRKSLAHASIDGTNLPVYDNQGNLQATFGVLPDGTYGANYYNPNPPPVPAPPSVTPTWGGLMIAHFGTTADGSDWPMDVSHIEIHLSSLELFFPTEATMVGKFTGVSGGGLYAAMGLTSGTTYWIRLVAVNTSEKKSQATAAISGIPDAVVPQEVLDQIDADLQVVADEVVAVRDSVTGVYYNDVTAGDPEPAGVKEDDTWFRPDQGYKLYRWNGTSWQPATFGAGALDAALNNTINQSATDSTAALGRVDQVEYRVVLAEDELVAVGAQADATAGLVAQIEDQLAETATQAGQTADSVAALAALVTKTTSKRHAIF